MLDFGTYRTDTYPAREGGELRFHLFGHASLAVEYNGKTVYIDPVSKEADYASLPKADVVLVTHEHNDHFDAEAIDAVRSQTTIVIANPAVAAKYGKGTRTMRNGDKLQPTEWLTIEAVPAYNVVRTQYHPKGRDNGYILTIGKERIYVAGDTERNDDVIAQKNIDYLFLPVNLPYTMTVDDAVKAASEIAPRVFYPYHTSGTPQEEIERMPSRLPEIRTVVWKAEK